MNIVIDLLFPKRCALCEEILAFGDDGICSECESELMYIKEPRCLKCGREIESETEEMCMDCQKYARKYVSGYPLLEYVSPVKDAIAGMKYHGKKNTANYFGHKIANRYKDIFQRIGIDVLIPVPVSDRKMKKRGYNQAEIIADAISDETGIKVCTHLLKRRSDTMPLKTLGPQEREKILSKAFSCDFGKIRKLKKTKNGFEHIKYDIRQIPEKVMLVDDIYTTGATIEACTCALMEVGVKKVYYTSVCIGNGTT